MSTFPKVRSIAGRDRLDTGRLIVGIAHQPPPPTMGSEAERVQSSLLPPGITALRGAMRPIQTQPTLIERLWERVRGF